MSPARNVHELNITNWAVTGSNVPIPQYTFDLEIKWTDADGEYRTHGPTTYTYPNDLASMPLASRRHFAEQQIDAMVRVTLGISEWEDYR